MRRILFLFGNLCTKTTSILDYNYINYYNHQLQWYFESSVEIGNMLRAGGKWKSNSPYAHTRRRGTAATRSRTYVNPVTSDAPSNSVSTQEEPGTTTVSHTAEPSATTSQPSSNVTVVPIPTTTLPSTSGTVPIAINVAISAPAPFNPTPLISVSDDVGLHVPQTIKVGPYFYVSGFQFYNCQKL
jgi:hypothetical protein